MKLLIVSKDIGGAEVTAPLAKVAIENGDAVTVITEGLAPAEFMKRGVPFSWEGMLGRLDWLITELKRLDPQAVVVSLGQPINLENLFAKAANEFCIPLVFIEDCTGAHVRSYAVPDMVLTLNWFSRELACKSYPHAIVETVGDNGVPGEEEKKTITALYSDLRLKGSETVIAYVGGEPDTTAEQLRLLLKCLELTKGKWCLVTRYHPKRKDLIDKANGRRYEEVWNEMLAPVWDRVASDPIGNGRMLAGSADIVCGDFSTLLTVAACCGNVSVFLETPSVLKHMKKETGLKVFPLAEMGCANRVAEPVDLFKLRPPKLGKLDLLKPYDPKLAYKHIKEFVG